MTRGKFVKYNYGNEEKSITDLLKLPDVLNYLKQGKKLT